jgi:hypothetical protein
MWSFKEEFFSRFGTLYEVRHFARLKEKKRFAKRHGVFVQHLYNNMLQWQSEPLHTSLSDGVERRVRIAAIQSFHLIQGWKLILDDYIYIYM